MLVGILLGCPSPDLMKGHMGARELFCARTLSQMSDFDEGLGGRLQTPFRLQQSLRLRIKIRDQMRARVGCAPKRLQAFNFQRCRLSSCDFSILSYPHIFEVYQTARVVLARIDNKQRRNETHDSARAHARGTDATHVSSRGANGPQRPRSGLQWDCGELQDNGSRDRRQLAGDKGWAAVFAAMLSCSSP